MRFLSASLLTCGLLAAALSQAAAAAAPTVRLTIADGEVTLLRGRSRFVAAEGQRLEAMDIVHTDAATRVARLEFDDGCVLDLGPATHVLLQPAGAGWPQDRAATAYVAQGWAKLRAPAGAAPARPAGLASAGLDLVTADGGVVLARIERQRAFAFVESGRARLVAQQAQRQPRVFELGEGHAYTRTDAVDSGNAALRPTLEQLREAPHALTDKLPLRAGEWTSRAAPELADPQALAASEVAHWLDTEPALRRLLRARFFGTATVARAGAGHASTGARSRPAKTNRVAAQPRPVPAAATEPRALAQAPEDEPGARPWSP